MKYLPKQYAEVLYTILEGKKESTRNEILKRFIAVLAKNRDLSRLAAIMRELEHQFLKKTGSRRVRIESASPISGNVKKEIGSIVGPHAIFEERVTPEIFAGIRITVDDEILIDASARRQIEKLFAQ